MIGARNEFALPASRSDWSPVNSSLIACGSATYTPLPKPTILTVKASPRAGWAGPALREDFTPREKTPHFDHERTPERVVHARGSGAHGFFECYEPQTRFTKASFLAEKGKRTPVFVRFSTVAGERG